MKQRIYTIAIHEAFGHEDGCPLCRIADDVERKAYELVLGPAMMEPDTRALTDRKGFCKTHLQGLFMRQNKLGLALILETLLMRVNDGSPEDLTAYAQSCYQCELIEQRMDGIVDNIAYLWDTEPAFAARWSAIEGFCLPHANRLVADAVALLGKKKGRQMAQAALEAAARRAAQLQPLVTTFCRSFDYRNVNVDIGEAKSAVEQACRWLGGWHG